MNDEKQLVKELKKKLKNAKTIPPDITIRIKDQYTLNAWEKWKKDFKLKNPKVAINDELNKFLVLFTNSQKKKDEFDWLKANEDEIVKLFKKLWQQQNMFYWDRFNEVLEKIYSEIESTKLLTIYLLNHLVKKEDRAKVLPTRLEITDEWLKDYIQTKTKIKKGEN